MKMLKNILLGLLLIIGLTVFFSLVSSNFFKDFSFKFHYWALSFQGTKEKVDVLNDESIAKAKADKTPVTIIIHGVGSEYYSDIYGTILWFKERGYNVFSFDYDFKASPTESAQKLDEFVKDILKKTETEKVDIVGICLGGIIARYYAEKFEGEKYVNKLATIAAPVVVFPKTDLAYLYDKYFRFDPDPWNLVMEKMTGKNPIPKHMYAYCKKDSLVPTKYQYASWGNFVGFDCGHLFVDVNPDILNSISDFLSRK